MEEVGTTKGRDEEKKEGKGKNGRKRERETETEMGVGCSRCAAAWVLSKGRQSIPRYLSTTIMKRKLNPAKMNGIAFFHNPKSGHGKENVEK